MVYKILAWIFSAIVILNGLLFLAFFVVGIIIAISDGDMKDIEKYDMVFISTFIIAPIGYGLSRLFFFLADSEF